MVTTGVDLAGYVRAHAPMPPQRAALFAGELAEQLATLHAEGRAHGPLEIGVQVDTAGGGPRPLIVRSGAAGPSHSATDDVWQVGLLLAHLLGVGMLRDGGLPHRPPEIAPPLWSVLQRCLEPNPAARPPAAVLARQLRDVARDLLLGVAPWQSVIVPAVGQ